MGKLYGISVGPGDPELMTIKGKRILENCMVVATPVTKGNKTLALDIAKGILSFDDKEILRLEFLMSRDKRAIDANHRENADKIIDYLKTDKDVAMLNLGDASLYSSFSYIADIVIKKGYEVEVIPGVTSFCAAAAKLNTSLTEMNKPLHIFPGAIIDDTIELNGTKILMKSGKKIKEVKEKLSGLDVMAVQNCGLKNEKICLTIEDIDDDATYFTTLLIK